MTVEQAQTPKNLSLEGKEDYSVVAPAIAAALQALEPISSTVSFVDIEKETKKTFKGHWLKWVIAAAWLLVVVTTLYCLDIHQANKLSQTLRDSQESIGGKEGLARTLAIGRYFEVDGPSPLDILDRISEAMPKSALLGSFLYQRDGELTLAGKINNEKEFQTMLQNLNKLGRAELKHGKSDKGKFHFQASLILPHGACRVPGSTEASSKKSTTSPSTKPAKKDDAKKTTPPKKDKPSIPKKAPDSQIKVAPPPLPPEVPSVPSTKPNNNENQPMPTSNPSINTSKGGKE